MADNQFLTVGDVYNPADTALKAQAIDAAKISNRIQAMKMREIYQQQRRKNNWNQIYNNPAMQFNPVTGQQGQSGSSIQNPVQASSGPQPVSQTAQAVSPQVPVELSEEDKAAMRGKKKLMAITQAAQPLIPAAKNDPTARIRINKLSTMLENDSDNKAYLSKIGFDEMSYKMDEETGEGTYSLAKNWSKEDLENYSNKAPNGIVLQGLPADKYRLKFNDIGAIVGVEKYGNENFLGDKNLTREQLAAKALYGPIADRAKYKAILDETRKMGGDISSGLSQDAIELEAERIVAGEKLGNYGYGKTGATMKSAVINRVAAIAKERGMDAADIIAQGAELAGQKGGMKNIIQREVSIGTFVKRIDATSDYVMKMAKELGSKDSRLLNIPRNQIVKFIGSGKYRAYELALYSLSAEIAKVETGQLGISAITDTQLKIMNGIHDPNLSIAELQNLINGGKVLGETAMDSIKGYRKELKAEISGNSNKDSKPLGDDPLGLR